MRSMASGARSIELTCEGAQAFLEAHEEAFRFFGGVFQQLRYDNLTSAVKKILRGHRGEETERFIAFRSHYRFASEFCTPAASQEKGGVEGEVEYFRRNHWTPVPAAADLNELNDRLLAAAMGKKGRRVSSHEYPVGPGALLRCMTGQGRAKARLKFSEQHTFKRPTRPHVTLDLRSWLL